MSPQNTSIAIRSGSSSSWSVSQFFAKTFCIHWHLGSLGVASCFPAKGQIISKGLYGFSIHPKRMKNFWPSRLGKKLTFSGSFLLELKTLEFPFEIAWPLMWRCYDAIKWLSSHINQVQWDNAVAPNCNYQSTTRYLLWN